MKSVLAVLILMSMIGCSYNRPSVKTGLEGKILPSFNVLLMDSLTHLDIAAIPGRKPIVLFLFSPDCPYCKAQTVDIVRDIKSLGSFHFYFLSPYPFKLIKGFSDHYQLVKYSNITVAQDDSLFVSNYFNTNAVPYIAVYGSDRKLKEIFKGKVNVKVIRDMIQ